MGHSSGKISVLTGNNVENFGLNFYVKGGKSSRTAADVTVTTGKSALATGGHLKISSKTSSRSHSGHLSIASNGRMKSGHVLFSSSKRGERSGPVRLEAQAAKNNG